MTTLLADLKTLYHMACRPIRGTDHAARLESFYAGQASHYDAFRRRLLPGREALYEALPRPDRGLWVELGAGTGANLELLGEGLGRLRRVCLVDLSASLLNVARQRIRRHGWSQVETFEADATGFALDEPADVVVCSFSLTMIPDWFAAIDTARRLLRPGGTLGVVDFYVSRKYPTSGRDRHSGLARAFWPLWFGRDNVFLSADHVPYLHRAFEPVAFREGRARIPYLPLVRVPYYTFIGRKPAVGANAGECGASPCCVNA